MTPAIRETLFLFGEKRLKQHWKSMPSILGVETVIVAIHSSSPGIMRDIAARPGLPQPHKVSADWSLCPCPRTLFHGLDLFSKDVGIGMVFVGDEGRAITMPPLPNHSPTAKA